MYSRIIADLQRGIYYQKCHDPVCKHANYKSQGLYIHWGIYASLNIISSHRVPNSNWCESVLQSAYCSWQNQRWLVAGGVSLEDLEDYSLESSNGDSGNGGGGGGGGTNSDGNGGGNGGGDGNSGNGGCGGGNGGGGGGNGGGGDGNSGNGGWDSDGGGNGGCIDYDGGGVEDDDYFDGGGGLDDETILDRMANEMDINFTDETSADHHSSCAVMRSTKSTVESSSCETDHQARGGIHNASDLSQSQSDWCSADITRDAGKSYSQSSDHEDSLFDCAYNLYESHHVA